MDKPSWLDRFAKALAVPGFLLAVCSLGWQIYTYRESHEEAPMVQGSLEVTWTRLHGDIEQLYRSGKNGKLVIEVTNIGQRTMQVKSVTLSAFKRVWVLRAPDEKNPTVSLEPGHGLSTETEWDFKKYPLYSNDQSEPADFLVEVQTTKAVHIQHINIHSYTVSYPLSDGSE